MEKIQKLKLKSFIKKLSNIRGRHTELVSVYIPAGYELNKIIKHLEQEQGTAKNIKSKENQKRVISSLEKMIRHLRLYEKTPEHGLAVFAGNVSGTESKVNIEVFSIEPPEPVSTRIYRCDQNFVLDILEGMLEEKEVYGLIVIDRREGNIGLLKGTRMEELTSFTSDVPGKTTKGGQSQQRYARIRDLATKEFYQKVGDAANKIFLEMEELKGIIIGGPIPTKEQFLDGDFLNNQLKKKVIGMKDLAYTGEFGLKELIDKSKDILKEQVITKEKKILEKFFTLLAKDPKKVTYGEEDSKKALEMGAVETLLLSESLDDEKIEDFEKTAEKYNTEVRIISIETEGGQQLKELGEVAAILRFAIS